MIRSFDVHVRKAIARNLSYAFNDKINDLEKLGWKILQVNFYKGEEYNFGKNPDTIGYNIIAEHEDSEDIKDLVDDLC